MVNNIQRNQEHLLILIITTNETLSNQRLLLTKSKMFIYLSNHPQLAGNKAKGRISKGVFQENNARQIFRKTNISNPLIRRRTWANEGVRNVRFSENLACFVFLKHPF